MDNKLDPRDFERPEIKEAINTWEELSKRYNLANIKNAHEWEEWQKENQALDPRIPSLNWNAKELANQYHAFLQAKTSIPLKKIEKKKTNSVGIGAILLAVLLPNKSREKTIRKKKKKIAGKWSGLLKKYPELKNIKTQEDFKKWQEAHLEIPRSTWSYKKYHDSVAWDKLQKKNKELINIKNEKEYNDLRTFKPQLPENGWTYKIAADNDLSRTTPSIKNSLAYQDRVQQIIKSGYELPQEKPQNQILTSEMEKYKEKHLAKTARKQKKSAVKKPSETIQKTADIKEAPAISPTMNRQIIHPEKEASQTKNPLTEVMSEEELTKAPNLHDLIKPMPKLPPEEISMEVEIPNEPMGGGDDEQPLPNTPPGTNIRNRINKTRSSRNARNITNQGKTLLQGIKTAGTIISTSSWLPWAIGAIVLLLLFILIVLFIGGKLEEAERDDRGRFINRPVANITKSGPVEAVNGTDLVYTLTVSYPGTASNIIVTDPIPGGAEYVSSNPTARLLDINGQQTTDLQSVKAVEWSLSDIQGDTNPIISVSSTKKDTSIYTSAPYYLPIPNGASDINYTGEQIQNYNLLGNTIAQYQPYLQGKVKDGSSKYTDPFLSVIYSGAVLNTRGNNYYWDCNGNGKTINDGCLGYNSGGLYVGYGIQISSTSPAINNLTEIFNLIYGAGSSDSPEKVQQTGQDVISLSAQATTGLITDPAIFPTDTVSNLITKANDGDDQSQRAVAILLMDRKISAVAVALETADQISVEDNWKGWLEQNNSNYLDPVRIQLLSNRMQAIADKYTGDVSRTFNNQILTLTLRPTNPDVYIVNKASAKVIGGNPINNPSEPSEPSDDNCSGYYDLTKNPLNQNFGDPKCTMLANKNPEDKEKLFALLQEKDPDNASYWFRTVIPCESGYYPNSYAGHEEVGTPDTAGAWGLFQMGRGKNGQYDHGDVIWETQTTNAVEYNNNLAKIGLEWKYWACARDRWNR